MAQGVTTAWLRADRLVRLGMVPAAVGTAALGLSVSGLALSERGLDLAPGLPTWLALVGFAISVAMAAAAWVVMSERPGVTIGMSVALLGLVVPSWAAWDWMPAAMLPILHAAAPLAVAGAAHVGLRWSRGSVRARAVRIAYALAALGALLVAVGYDPLADPGCAFTCADADPVAASLVTTRLAVGMTAALLSAGAVVAGWSIAVRRREPLALRAGALASLGILVASWTARSVWWADGPLAVTLVAAHAVAGGVLVVGVFVSTWAVWRNRMAAERLITELNDAGAAGGPKGPGHAVEFAVPDEDRWVDADGQPVPTEITRDDAVALYLGADSGVRVWLSRSASVPSFDAISPGARVALANARLNAVIKARVADVHGSRRRIVRASHAERQRIARDLHDGAQQRLITASLHLSVAEGALPTPVVDGARTAIGSALDGLRRLAHGLVPAVPADGLPGILDDLLRESSVPARLEMDDVAVDDDVAVAIHAAVQSVLAHAGTARAHGVRVAVAPLEPRKIGLEVEVRGSSGVDEWDRTAVADLIGAVGGSMSVQSSPMHLVVSAELPCAS